MQEEKSDANLVLLSLAGDQDAFKTIIEKYTPLIFNFVARFVGRENAPDTTQEIFIKAWKNLDKFDSARASFKTWLFTIAKNTTTDFLRKKRAYTFSELDTASDEDFSTFAENIPDTELLPMEVLQKLEDINALNKLLEQLPEKYRLILILHYQEEMTFDEIGKVLAKPLNTVKSQHRRALQMMRKFSL